MSTAIDRSTSKLRQFIGGKPSWRLALVLVLSVAFFIRTLTVFADGIIPSTRPGEHTLATDKNYYHPGEIAIITGSGYAPGEYYDPPVMRPDGSIILIDPNTSVAPDLGWAGLKQNPMEPIYNEHQANGIMDINTIKAYQAIWDQSWEAEALVVHTFTDSVSSLSPGSYGGIGAPIISPFDWVNENLNQNKSHYF